MNKETLINYLKMVGMQHTNVNELWADLISRTKAQIVQWCLDCGLKDIRELRPYLRSEQIKSMNLEKRV